MQLSLLCSCHFLKYQRLSLYRNNLQVTIHQQVALDHSSNTNQPYGNVVNALYNSIVRFLYKFSIPILTFKFRFYYVRDNHAHSFF